MPKRQSYRRVDNNVADYHETQSPPEIDYLEYTSALIEPVLCIEYEKKIKKNDYSIVLQQEKMNKSNYKWLKESNSACGSFQPIKHCI